MAAVALQRELDAYSDAIGKYNQQARAYKSAASTHNANVDAYNAFVKQKTAGNYNDYHPNVYYAENKGRYLISGDMMKEVKTADLSNYYVRHLGSNKYVLVAKQKDDMPAPGEFTREQPTTPGKAPSATTGQIRRLDAPSLTDVERTGSSGLISSAFNY